MELIRDKFYPYFVLSEWEDGDDIELRDLPHWDPRKPDLGIDTSKVLIMQYFGHSNRLRPSLAVSQSL